MAQAETILDQSGSSHNNKYKSNFDMLQNSQRHHDEEKDDDVVRYRSLKVKRLNGAKKVLKFSTTDGNSNYNTSPLVHSLKRTNVLINNSIKSSNESKDSPLVHTIKELMF